MNFPFMLLVIDSFRMKIENHTLLFSIVKFTLVLGKKSMHKNLSNYINHDQKFISILE